MVECIKLIELCKGRKVYIQTHNFPDPDAIASAYGLQKLFAYYGIESKLCYAGKIDKLSTRKMTEIFMIELFSYEQIRENMKKEDYIICVDSQKGGGNITDFIGDEVACIDHHPVYVNMDYQYRDIRETGSCATIIAEYFRQLDVPMDSLTASALLYGIKMDTMQLSRGVTDLDIQMFYFLFTMADQSLLMRLEKNSMEFRDLKAYGAAIENIKIYGKIGFAYIPFSCPDALIAIISDFILQLEEVDFAIVYSKREDGIKFSVRSEDVRMDAGEIINKAMEGIGNGGGHATMAGGMIRRENVTALEPHLENFVIERFLGTISSCTGKDLSTEPLLE